MSDELNKEMEEVVEEESVEEASAPKANKGTVKLKQQPHDMQKPGGGPSAKAPATKGTKGFAAEAKDEDEEEEEEKVDEEEVRETPKLKSDILAGLVNHMKGLKKEDLAKIYGTTILGEGDEPEEDEDDDDKEEEDEEKIKKESIDQVIDSLDVSDDVAALTDGEELSEEFKTKAATIFETAVKSKVRVELEKIQEENDKVMEDLAESTMGDLVEKVDDYMNYVVEQWMEDNQLAIERGLKGEIAEDFISGMKQLFEDHYIDVPDEKYDILESNLTKIEELEEKLNKQMEENVQLKKQKGELVKESMISDIADGMTDTETEKFQSLVGDVEFSDEDSYKEKLQTIKESYFGVEKEVNTGQVLTEEGSTETPVESSGTMAQYLSAIGKDAKRDKK